MLTFLGFVAPIVVAVLAYRRGKAVRSEAAYMSGYEDGREDGYDAANVDWHRRMFESDRRHEARLQAVIAVATRPDARVVLPEFPKPPCTNA